MWEPEFWLNKLLRIFKSELRCKLPHAQIPKRFVYYACKALQRANLPYRGLYQLLFVEQKALKECIVTLSKNWTIKGYKSPYGALLLCLKEKDVWKGLFNYTSLKKITKNALIWRTDEIIDRIENAKNVFNNILETEFCQTKKNYKEIEETEFNIKYSQFKYNMIRMKNYHAPEYFILEGMN